MINKHELPEETTCEKCGCQVENEWREMPPSAYITIAVCPSCRCTVVGLICPPSMSTEMQKLISQLSEKPYKVKTKSIDLQLSTRH